MTSFTETEFERSQREAFAASFRQNWGASREREAAERLLTGDPALFWKVQAEMKDLSMKRSPGPGDSPSYTRQLEPDEIGRYRSSDDPEVVHFASRRL